MTWFINGWRPVTSVASHILHQEDICFVMFNSHYCRIIYVHISRLVPTLRKTLPCCFMCFSITTWIKLQFPWRETRMSEVYILPGDVSRSSQISSYRLPAAEEKSGCSLGNRVLTFPYKRIKHAYNLQAFLSSKYSGRLKVSKVSTCWLRNETTWTGREIHAKAKPTGVSSSCCQ